MIERIFPKDVFEMQKAGQKVQLVDVRSVEEFQEVHAQGAIHVALDEISAERLRAEGLDDSQAVYLICRSGARSLRGCEILEQEGFGKLYNVEGGTLAWLEAGLPQDLG